MINIQDEVAKIHGQFGTSEMANYKIQLLCEQYAKESANVFFNKELQEFRDSLKESETPNQTDRIFIQCDMISFLKLIYCGEYGTILMSDGTEKTREEVQESFKNKI